jgi:outer membrane protein insertion porin family
VQEQATGELSLSAGFSSLESFVFQGSIRQNNFRGRGQSIGLGINYSTYSQAFNVSFTEPYLFDRNISGGVDIYRRDYNNGYYDRATATYEQATTGFALRAGVPLTEYMSLLVRYTFNHDERHDRREPVLLRLRRRRGCRMRAAARRPLPVRGRRQAVDLADRRVADLRLARQTACARRAARRGDQPRLRPGSAATPSMFRAFAQGLEVLERSARGFILSVTGQSGFIYGLEEAGAPDPTRST